MSNERLVKLERVYRAALALLAWGEFERRRDPRSDGDWLEVEDDLNDDRDAMVKALKEVDE